MTTEEARPVYPAGHVDARVQVPPSKSYTNRALVAAALADGTSTLINPSECDDTRYLVSALEKFGISIRSSKGSIEITGSGGHPHLPPGEIYLGNAGTAMRFLAAFACLAPGETVLRGDEQMNKRPIGDLMDALRKAGIRCSSHDGFPPVKIQGGNFSGGIININSSVSSQFVSSVLLSAPYAKRTATLHLNGKLSSMPYVDMTLHVMRSFGARIDTPGPVTFTVDNTQHYIGHDFHIEADASSAAYFFAAAAVTGGRVKVTNLSLESLQGDIKFLNILQEMGCTVIKQDEMIELRGAPTGRLRAVEVDMNEIPDCVPTLAVLAAFARGTTAIGNVRHLRFKETDRLSALGRELTKIGARVEVGEDDLIIHPDKLRGAEIETYNDHRIAMSFAVAGLKTSGISIKNPSCVSKSFPDFWEVFSKLEHRK